MITGYNDWDAFLEEAYVKAVLEGRIAPPKQLPKMTLEDYGKSMTFTIEEIMDVLEKKNSS